MRNIARWLGAFLLAAPFAAAGPARAQVVYGTPPEIETGFVMTGWTLEQGDRKVTVRQVVAPLSGFLPLRDNAELRYFLARGSSQAEVDGDVHRLSGLSDLRFQFNRSLAQDRVFLALGLNLPTGKRGLDLESEWLVSHYLSQDFLSIPLRRLGAGLGLSFMAGGAVERGPFLLGATVAYEIAGAYESYAGIDDYDPGDQFNLSLRAETTRDGARAWAGFTYADYTGDTVDGVLVYDQNWYARTSLGVEKSTRHLRLETHGSYLVRDGATTYDEAGAALNNLRLYGNELYWSISGAWLGGRQERPWHLGPVAAWRLIDGNEYGTGRAAVLTLGVDGGFCVSSRIRAGLGLRLYTGDAAGGGLDLSGYQTSLTVVGNL
ncbi:MAG: hypothetical protein IPK64_00155 [bacterium]|nr:hypothetical protein [bacterium]